MNMPGYIGDKKTMIVYHLANEQLQCNVYYFEPLERQYFTPDLLDNVKTLGFSPCKWCN